jgi:prophage antirepressor-like protein
MISFEFDSANVRVLQDEKGEPLFVGKDLCEVLGYTNPSKAMGDHCKGVTKRYPLQTPGGMQEVRVLTEPDMLRLIVNSKLPAAQKFEAWVFEEVLPTLRKTGEYKIPKKRETSKATLAAQAAVLLPKFKAALESVGITGNAATLSANQGVVKVTGVDFLALVGQTHLVADKRGRTITATELAAFLGLPHPRAANDLLIEHGFAVRTEYGVAPTALGEQHGEWYDTGKRHRSGTPVKQFKWFEQIAAALMNSALGLRKADTKPA